VFHKSAFYERFHFIAFTLLCKQDADSFSLTTVVTKSTDCIHIALPFDRVYIHSRSQGVSQINNVAQGVSQFNSVTRCSTNLQRGSGCFTIQHSVTRCFTNPHSMSASISSRLHYYVNAYVCTVHAAVCFNGLHRLSFIFSV
jgi:hypothetical protein